MDQLAFDEQQQQQHQQQHEQLQHQHKHKQPTADDKLPRISTSSVRNSINQFCSVKIIGTI